MERIVRPARKLAGEATVPGELESASQALVLAALAQGESRIRNAPLSCQRLVGLLRDLGIAITEEPGVLVVQGRGRLGFSAPRDTVNLEGLGEEALYLLALLCGQEFSTRVYLGEAQEEGRQLLTALAPAGAAPGDMGRLGQYSRVPPPFFHPDLHALRRAPICC